MWATLTLQMIPWQARLLLALLALAWVLDRVSQWTP